MQMATRSDHRHATLDNDNWNRTGWWYVSPRAIVMQQKTSRPVQFEITQSTRDAVSDWIKEVGKYGEVPRNRGRRCFGMAEQTEV